MCLEQILGDICLPKKNLDVVPLRDLLGTKHELSLLIIKMNILPPYLRENPTPENMLKLLKHRTFLLYYLVSSVHNTVNTTVIYLQPIYFSSENKVKCKKLRKLT